MNPNAFTFPIPPRSLRQAIFLSRDWRSTCGAEEGGDGKPPTPLDAAPLTSNLLKGELSPETPLEIPVVQVQNLTVQRGKHRAIHQVSFTLRSGTDTAIVGPNGAGKSTLIQALLGILPHQGGEISILGRPLSPTGYLDPVVRQQIAYLPQNFLIDRQIPMTVNELVGLGWDKMGWGLSWPWSKTHRRDRRHAIATALEKVNASHLRHQRLSSLSGGETKRVLLAYCLVRPRRLLILDEAPAGLDVRSEWEFYDLLQRLKQEEGWAILQVSHDLDRVHRNCDRVICLNQIIRCEGTPAHTLTEENLSLIYGIGVVPYHHSCR